MKDKTKKWLVTAGLAAVCVGLVFGISRTLYREPSQKPLMGAEDTGKAAKIIIDIGKTQTELAHEKETEMETDMKETKSDTEENLVIEIDRNTRVAVSDREQEIQPEPKKTQNEKPDDPPASSESGNAGNTRTQSADETSGESVTQPTVEIPKETKTQPSKETTPSHGDTKDGMIYIDGFGWIPNEGGGGQGIYAADMYENGNKIGIMD